MLDWSCGWRTEDGHVHWFAEFSFRSPSFDLETDRQRARVSANQQLDLSRQHSERGGLYDRPGELLVCTVAERHAIMLRPQFAALDPIQQELLRIVHPDLAVALDNPDADLTCFPSLRRLQSSALHTLHNLGLSAPCPRCCGSGEYSRCERFGTTCLTCGVVPGKPGRGWVAPRITRKLLAALRQRLAQQATDCPPT